MVIAMKIKYFIVVGHIILSVLFAGSAYGSTPEEGAVQEAAPVPVECSRIHIEETGVSGVLCRASFFGKIADIGTFLNGVKTTYLAFETTASTVLNGLSKLAHTLIDGIDGTASATG